MLRDIWKRPIATAPSVSTDAALLIGRILIVLGLFPNGLRKIATFEQTAAGMGGTPQVIGGRPFPDQTPLFTFPTPEFFLGTSVLFDLAGAALIVLGFKTRTVGFLLAGYVLVAITVFHSDIRHAQDLMHLVRNLPFPAGLILLGGVGAGHWSLDGVAERRASRPVPNFH